MLAMVGYSDDRPGSAFKILSKGSIEKDEERNHKAAIGAQKVAFVSNFRGQWQIHEDV